MRSDVQLSAAKKESLKWNRLLMEYEEARKDRYELIVKVHILLPLIYLNQMSHLP